MAGELTNKLTYGTVESKAQEMIDHAKKTGGTVKKEGIYLVERNKQGKAIASLWVNDHNNDGKPESVRYNDPEGREYIGVNSGRKFTTIYSPDDLYVAKDTNKDGKVNDNEIKLNLNM